MKARIRYSNWIPRLLKVDAIVLYPFVLFAMPSKEVTDRMWKHEWAHVEQVRDSGWIRFYLSYLLFYFAWRVAGAAHYHAYRQIPWEEDARHKEKEIL